MGLNLPNTGFSVEEEEEEKDAGEKSGEETAPAPTFLDDSRALKKDLENYYTGPPAWTETRYGIFKAFGRLGNAFVTKADFRNALLGSLGLGLAPVAVAASAPGAIAATATGLTNPSTANALGDFVAGALDSGPAPLSVPGALGALTSRTWNEFTD